MEKRDFTTTILTDQTPQEAFAAINNPRAWWSENIEGSTDQLNSEFDYHYKEVHRCKIQVIELVLAQKVVWLVKENYFSFIADKSEWIGTKMIFDISREGKQTAIRFTHEGLVPQYECYEVCNEAWTHFIHDSLRSLIATGKGDPSPKEETGFNAEMTKKWGLE